MSVAGMKSLIKTFMNEYGEPVLNMMFHSMELLPGRTPFVRNKTQQKMYLKRLGGVVQYLREDACFKSSMLIDLYNMKSRERLQKKTEE